MAQVESSPEGEAVGCAKAYPSAERMFGRCAAGSRDPFTQSGVMPRSVTTKGLRGGFPCGKNPDSRRDTKVPRATVAPLVFLVGSERLQEVSQEWVASCGGGLTADALRAGKGSKSGVEG